MKKANTNTQAQETKKEYTDWFKSILDDADKVVATKKVNEKGNMTQYELCTGVILCIFDSDKDYDFGYLSIYGVNINLSFRNTKNGFMASYPSYKTAKGEYKNLVTSYSKSLNELIKAILTAHYAE